MPLVQSTSLQEEKVTRLKEAEEKLNEVLKRGGAINTAHQLSGVNKC